MLSTESDDTQHAEQTLKPVWFAVSRRAAVAVGASAALLSLLRNVSVGAASRRGMVAFLAVTLLARFGFWLVTLVHQSNLDSPEPAEVATEDAQG